MKYNTKLRLNYFSVNVFVLAVAFRQQIWKNWQFCLTFCLLNERHIGINPENPNEGVYLYPNDLLLGKATSRINSVPFSDDVNERHQFKFVQMLINSFWKKWMRDFFHCSLFDKSGTAHHNLEMGDIVLTQDTNVLWGHWKIGKISNVLPSTGGKVGNIEVA